MTRFTVENMSCGHCKTAVTRAIAGVDPAAQTTVDLKEKLVEVESSASDEALMAALRDEGYPAARR